MDWELLKKIDPTKIIGGEASPLNLITGGDRESAKPSKDNPITGLYYKKPSIVYKPDKNLSCTIEFFESQLNSCFEMGLLKSITVGNAARYFAEACKFVVKNKPQKALARLGDVLNKEPQYSDAYFLMGCILLEAEQYDKANSCFQKVLLCQKSLGKDLKRYLPTFHVTLNLNLPSTFCIFPELLGASLLVAISYWENNKKDEAISALEQTLSIFPKNHGVLYLMNYFKLEMGKYRDIINSLSELEPSDHLSLATYTLLGIALYSSYDPTASIQVLKNAIKLAERIEDDAKLIHYHLGRAYLNKGDKFEGLQELKKISSIDPLFLDINNILQEPALGAKPYKEKSDIKEQVIIKQPSEETAGKEQKEETVRIQKDQLPEEIKLEYKAALQPETELPAGAELTGKEQGVSSSRLIIKQTGEAFSIQNSSENTIGREPSNTIAFPEDFSISRRQARITCREKEFFIEDLGSTNGTYLNKRRITKKMPLNRNDEIQIGKKIFTFILE